MALIEISGTAPKCKTLPLPFPFLLQGGPDLIFGDQVTPPHREEQTEGDGPGKAPSGFQTVDHEDQER